MTWHVFPPPSALQQAYVQKETRRNTEYIYKETGAQIFRKEQKAYGSHRALTLSITATDAVADNNFDNTVEMCEDIVPHIHEEAAQHHGYGHRATHQRDHFDGINGRA